MLQYLHFSEKTMSIYVKCAIAGQAPVSKVIWVICEWWIIYRSLDSQLLIDKWFELFQFLILCHIDGTGKILLSTTYDY